MKIFLIGSIVYILEMRIGSYFSHLRCPQTPSRHELVCSVSSSKEKLVLWGFKVFLSPARKEGRTAQCGVGLHVTALSLHCDYLGITEAAFLGPWDMPRLTLGLWQVFLHDTSLVLLISRGLSLRWSPNQKSTCFTALPRQAALQERPSIRCGKPTGALSQGHRVPASSLGSRVYALAFVFSALVTTSTMSPHSKYFPWWLSRE